MKLFANIQNTDKKTIFITESQMMDLLIEAATIQDIYQKYYAQIPQDIFQKIISYDPTYNPDKPNKMGKFGKWLLSIYQKGNLKIEDLYKAQQYLQTFIKFNSKITPNDITQYKSLVDLYNKIKPFLDNPQQIVSKGDEIRKIKEGAEKVYEDNKWIVIVPHTEESSCYYGKGTQWCTAAEKSHNMFNFYNQRGKLYINILKGTDTKYQFHFETQSFMDATDNEIKRPIAETIGLTPQLIQFYTIQYEELALPLYSYFGTEETERVSGINEQYYVDEETKATLLYYDRQKHEMNIVEHLGNNYDDEFCDFALFNRFIPITTTNDYCYYINLYDTKTKQFVFRETDDVNYISICRGYEYIIVMFNNSNTQGIFSLKDLKFTTQINKNEHIRILNGIINKYPTDLAVVYDDLKKQLLSLSKGTILTNTKYQEIKKEGIYYNVKGKTIVLDFISLIKGNDTYHDADIVLYDGTIVPLPELAQNAEKILKQHPYNIPQT